MNILLITHICRKLCAFLIRTYKYVVFLTNDITFKCDNVCCR